MPQHTPAERRKRQETTLTPPRVGALGETRGRVRQRRTREEEFLIEDKPGVQVRKKAFETAIASGNRARIDDARARYQRTREAARKNLK